MYADVVLNIGLLIAEVTSTQALSQELVFITGHGVTAHGVSCSSEEGHVRCSESTKRHEAP